MKKYIGALLLAAGLSGLLYAVYIKQDAKHKEEAVIDAFEEILEQNKKEDDPLKPEEEKEEVVFIDKEGYHGNLPVDEIIGIVEIPALDVKAPLTEGEEERLLRYSVGHVSGTAMPGKAGNFVVGGHRNYVYSSYFKYLHKLSEGDLIHVKTLDGNYTYKVRERRTVAPREVWVMDETETPTATLITCTIDSQKRTIVFADIIEDERKELE